jgi:hypothetical protein
MGHVAWTRLLVRLKHLVKPIEGKTVIDLIMNCRNAAINVQFNLDGRSKIGCLFGIWYGSQCHVFHGNRSLMTVPIFATKSVQDELCNTKHYSPVLKFMQVLKRILIIVQLQTIIR